jgi:AraC-like DNA-binding protein/quercetin dioxygenase-like cupin family protein
MRRTEYSILLDSRFQDEEKKASFEYIEVIKTKRKPQHSHPELEILLVLKGSGLRIIGDSVEEFEDGDLCLVGPDLYHTWFSRVVEKPTIRALVIHFLPELFGDHLLSLPEFQSIKKMFEDSKHGLFISGKTRDRISRMMHEIGRHHPVSPKRFCLLLSILTELSSSDDYRPLADEEGNPVYHGKQNEILAKIHRLLQNNLHNPLSQSWVAGEVGMSSAAFSRYFKRHTGKTYTDYVNELRIKFVCRALLESSMDVSTIAIDMGFNNISYFNQIFKRMKGMTPSEYRRMLAEPISA